MKQLCYFFLKASKIAFLELRRAHTSSLGALQLCVDTVPDAKKSSAVRLRAIAQLVDCASLFKRTVKISNIRIKQTIKKKRYEIHSHLMKTRKEGNQHARATSG